MRSPGSIPAVFGGIAIAKNLLCLAYSDVRGKVFLIDLDERRPVSFWEFGPADGGYADAGGVAMAPDFAIYVADTRNDVVRRFTPFGKEIGAVGMAPTRGPGAASRDRIGFLDRPRSVAVHDNIVYVTCGERELRRGVQRFEREGASLKPLAACGEVTAQFGAPRGIHADDRGILVADTLHGAVQRFDRAGRFIGQIETAMAPGESSRPVAVTRLVDGDILIADHGDFRGLARFGIDGRRRPVPDIALDNPTDLALDDRGRIYVLDRDGDRVRRLNSDLRVEVQVVDLAEIRD